MSVIPKNKILVNVEHSSMSVDSKIMDSLPENYTYKFVETNESRLAFRIKEVSNKETALAWRAAYERKSKYTWKIARTHPKVGKVNVFHEDYKCDHNKDYRHKRKMRISIHTGCEATLKIKIKRFVKGSRSQIPDVDAKEYPCIIIFKNKHNHCKFETFTSSDSYENIEDITHSEVKILGKKDINILQKVFNSEEFTTGLSDVDSVNNWVLRCAQFEDSPILYYRQNEDEILLIIMTEFQKNILVSSDKKILCLDNAHKEKGRRFYMLTLMALDECEVAYPVAFCISSKVDVSVVKQFLMSVRDSTGPLSCSYFMSDSKSFYFEAWEDVMGGNSKWVWCKWYIDRSLLIHIRKTKLPTSARADLYKRLKVLLECPNSKVFETMFANFTDDLCGDARTKNLSDIMSQTYGKNKELWAHCYHNDVKLSKVIQLEVLHRAMRFCCMEGRKSRVDKFIFAVMKLVKFKMLDRIGKILDDEKISIAVEAINTQHNQGYEIPALCISSIGDKLWMISNDEDGNVYVVREYDSCPEFCSLKCSQCDICVHMYSCSCISNLVCGDLCPHIHAVVWKFGTSHSSSAPDNDFNIAENDHIESSPPRQASELSSNSSDFNVAENDHVESSTSNQTSELFDLVLNMTHDVVKKFRSSKSALNKEDLNAVRHHLNCCLDICSGQRSRLHSSDVPNSNETNTQPQTINMPNTIGSILPTNPKQAQIGPQAIIIANTMRYILPKPTNLASKVVKILPKK